MRPEIRALIASTVIVVVYPIVVLVITWPLGVLWGGQYASEVSRALIMPLDLPALIMRSFYPNALNGLRYQIDLIILILGSFIAFNAILYYVPIRLVLEWRESKQKLR